jgi:hypothetical protein
MSLLARITSDSRRLAGKITRAANEAGNGGKVTSRSVSGVASGIDDGINRARIPRRRRRVKAVQSRVTIESPPTIGLL